MEGPNFCFAQFFSYDIEEQRIIATLVKMLYKM